jgi:hypothetical protein
MTLQEAIDRSVSHTEVVAVEFGGGDEADLVAELHTLYDGEINSVEADGKIDVWGYQTEAGDGEMDWRLSVTLT